jgi:hypothetical protein
MTRSSAHPEVLVQLACVCPAGVDAFSFNHSRSETRPSAGWCETSQPGGQAADLVGGEDFTHNNTERMR